jgi:hypothetical protein
MALWLAFTGSMFYLPDGQGKLAAIAIGIYMFAISKFCFERRIWLKLTVSRCRLLS